jgi:hypothetical protein
MYPNFVNAARLEQSLIPRAKLDNASGYDFVEDKEKLFFTLLKLQSFMYLFTQVQLNSLWTRRGTFTS